MISLICFKTVWVQPVRSGGGLTGLSMAWAGERRRATKAVNAVILAQINSVRLQAHAVMSSGGGKRFVGKRPAAQLEAVVPTKRVKLEGKAAQLEPSVPPKRAKLDGGAVRDEGFVHVGSGCFTGWLM